MERTHRNGISDERRRRGARMKTELPEQRDILVLNSTESADRGQLRGKCCYPGLLSPPNPCTSLAFHAKGTNVKLELVSC